MDVDFREFVSGSSLPAEDKSLWQGAFDLLDDDGVAVIDEMVGGEEERLGFLTEILKMKIDYIKKPNNELLNDILNKEAEELGRSDEI